jgi:hypothetical protein
MLLRLFPSFFFFFFFFFFTSYRTRLSFVRPSSSNTIAKFNSASASPYVRD